MTYWIQHGYGKATKIDTVAATGYVSGVILSPGDEDRATLRSTARSLSDLGLECVVDPQLYVHTIGGGSARCHKYHGLDFGDISWDVSLQEISHHVDQTLEVNALLETEVTIAPSPYQASFGDTWSTTSIQYARTTIDKADTGVYVSLVAEDAAFSDWEKTLEHLDSLTKLDARGIYLIVSSTGMTYPVRWDAERLSNILRVIYTLGEYNHYELLWGYSDVAGILGLAAGATGAATGWFHSLRMWTPQKWLPRDGGRQANPRVFVRPLLSSLGHDEAVRIARSSEGSRAFPDQNERRRLRQEAAWSISDSWIQHLVAMAEVHQTIIYDTHIKGRVNNLIELVDEAIDLYDDLVSSGVALDRAHHQRLDIFRRALDRFATEEQL